MLAGARPDRTPPGTVKRQDSSWSNVWPMSTGSTYLSSPWCIDVTTTTDQCRLGSCLGVRPGINSSRPFHVPGLACLCPNNRFINTEPYSSADQNARDTKSTLTFPSIASTCLATPTPLAQQSRTMNGLPAFAFAFAVDTEPGHLATTPCFSHR